MLIGGTASATVPFFTVAVQTQGIGGSAKICLAASVFMMIFCVLRLGRHVARVPHAVISGFSCGVGAMMVILQLQTLLGLPAAPGGGGSSPIGRFVAVTASLGRARWEPLLLGVIVVATAALAARRWPRSPAPLIGVVLAVAAAALLGWHERSLGAMSREWPEFVGFTWEPTDILDVLPQALGLALVASVNILITSKVVEHFQGRHRQLRAIDADGELGAYGIANLCAGVFGAPMSVGIPARSLANVRCGGTAPVQLTAWPLPSRITLVRRRTHRAYPAGRTCRSDRLCWPRSPGMEHLATLASDAPGRCFGLPGHGRGRLDHQRRRRRRDRLCALPHRSARLEARSRATPPRHRATRGGFVRADGASPVRD